MSSRESYGLARFLFCILVLEENKNMKKHKTYKTLTDIITILALILFIIYIILFILNVRMPNILFEMKEVLLSISSGLW